MHKASVGSISHGTLKTDDLLESFGWELQHMEGVSPEHLEIAKQARERAHYFTFNDLPYGETVEVTDEDSELVNTLIDLLTEYAPPYCYFGASEGDGSDFGYWPIIEQIEELPSIEMIDGEEIPQEDHKHVNDHGNVTVYGADGSVLLELV